MLPTPPCAYCSFIRTFPGQFRHLAAALAQAGHDVHAVAISPRLPLPGVSRRPPPPAATHAGSTLGGRFRDEGHSRRGVRPQAARAEPAGFVRSSSSGIRVGARRGWSRRSGPPRGCSPAGVLLWCRLLNFDPEFATDARAMACRFGSRTTASYPGSTRSIGACRPPASSGPFPDALSGPDQYRLRGHRHRRGLPAGRRLAQRRHAAGDARPGR